MHEQWAKQYGHTFTYTGILGTRRLITLDPKALAYVMNHSAQWQKPELTRNFLADFFGKGVLFAEGEAHKRQNPSFAISHIRELTNVFHEKSQQLRDIWQRNLAEEGASMSVIDVVPWLGQATLDIIGLAGFDYEFNALNADGEKNELNQAFTTITKQGQRFGMFQIAQTFFSPLKLIPTKQSRTIANATAVMDRLGRQFINNKKQAILAEAAARTKGTAGQAYVEKNTLTTRDLLSRLMVANMANDLPENQRLSDEEVMAQIPTFLIAGHETTASATTWCLYALSRDQEIQRKLREELLRLDTDNPSMDELNSLPYLDAVIKETMRLHAAVTGISRVATQDDVIPLSKPLADKKGRWRHEILHLNIDQIFIPILCVNRNEEIWGKNALEFRPERWFNLTDKINGIPGVVPGVLSFIAGPRSCIGYRFALVEFKCLIFTLVRAFEFEMAVDPEQIIKKSNIVTRPYIMTEIEKGPQLPLKLAPYRGV
ncbi:hypothetical protein M422DRAFT_34466 [Sphaerobolus stellatus SS14]|uniref:Cytochrome P450 n=1 Tax=Sphaerobolus stellatus (strain SS14) TaxID=990650 RepID=A0A0C9VEW2_SPHS4|nr:hypothetical protein M422DRAFT_34466 [Sphaerobolus stellatus SS14]